MEVLKFQMNVPETVALAFETGKAVEGRYGDQTMFSLMGNQVMYVPRFFGDQINALGLRRGDQIVIGKFEVKQGQRRSVQWQVSRAGEETPAPGPAGANGGIQSPPAGSPDGQRGVRTDTASAVQGDGNTGAAGKPNGSAKSNGQGPAAAAPPPACTQIPDAMAVAGATMVAALCAAIDAVAIVEKYAHEQGTGLRFSTDDIRSIALTLYIQFGKGGGR